MTRRLVLLCGMASASGDARYVPPKKTARKKPSAPPCPGCGVGPYAKHFSWCSWRLSQLPE